MTRHNTDLTFSRSDNTRTVRSDQANAQLVTLNFRIQHIQCRNTFSNTNDQLNAGISGFKDRVFTERSWYVNNRSFSTGCSNRVFNGIEYRQTQVFSTTFTRSYTTNHFGAVCNRLFRVESTLSTGKALADHFGVFID